MRFRPLRRMCGSLGSVAPEVKRFRGLCSASTQCLNPFSSSPSSLQDRHRYLLYRRPRVVLLTSCSTGPTWLAVLWLYPAWLRTDLCFRRCHWTGCRVSDLSPVNGLYQCAFQVAVIADQFVITDAYGHLLAETPIERERATESIWTNAYLPSESQKDRRNSSFYTRNDDMFHFSVVKAAPARKSGNRVC